MASPNSTFDELVTTTLNEHPDDIADNVSGHNALYRRLKDKGQIRAIDGGNKIIRPLDHAENSTAQRYSGFDLLSVQASEVLSAAEFAWVQSAVHVVASGLEIRKNSGKNQIIDLVESRVKNARRTAANLMSVDLYSSGSLSNQMGGLGLIINTAGTGTVGSINSSNYSFWQNSVREAAGTNTISKTTIRGEMMMLWMLCSRGTDKPDLIIMSHDFFSMYWDGLTDLQRFASPDKGVVGFNSLKFLDADVIFDSNSNFATTAEKAYFINTDYLQLVEHRAARWTPLAEKSSVNQDAVVKPLIWQGNLTCSNRARQGILLDVA